MNEDRTDHSQRLNEIIAEYLEAVETGNTPDRDELLAAHSDLANDLRSFFTEHDHMQAAAGSQEDVTLPPAAAGEDATLPPEDVQEDATLAPATYSHDTAQLGTRVRYFGDYELLEEIARGGMGVVYKATQVSLNRIVALKMILAGQLAGEEDVKRFHAEAEAAANLDHPGIVPIYEIGEHEDQHYFSMGYVDGESLADKIKDGPLPPREAAEYTRKVADAVAFAHERGVIHRDLKPGNVLIDRNGEPKVTDFGLAKRIEGDSDLTATGQILGTPSYMPPEQAAGKTDDITESADVYSLGAIFYCLLTGHPPFQAASTMDTLLQVLEKEPVAPQQLNPAVDLDFQTIALKCLEKEPKRRYASAKELGEELQRFLNGEPIQARPISSLERSWRWCKRKPIVASLLAAVVVLLIGGTTVSSFFGLVASQQARKAKENLGTAQRELSRAESLLYANQLREASSSWQTHRAGDAWTALDATREDFRGWEYGHLRHRFLTNSIVLLNGVERFDFSPDYDKLFAVGYDSCVREMDISTRKAVDLFALYPDSRERIDEVITLASKWDTYHISAGSDDQHLVLGENYRRLFAPTFCRIQLVDKATGKQALEIDTREERILAVQRDPTGKLVAVANADGCIRLWDVRTGQLVKQLQSRRVPVRCIAFSRYGDLLVSGQDDGSVVVWDVITGEILNHSSVGENQVNGVAFHVNKSRFAAGGIAGNVSIWDANTGTLQLRITGPPGEITDLEFDPSGGTLFVAYGDGNLRVFDSTIGSLRNTLTGHTAAIRQFKFNPRNCRLYSVDRNGELRMWRIPPARVEEREPATEGLLCVASCITSDEIALGYASGKIEIRDASQRLVTSVEMTHPVLALDLSPNGRHLVAISSKGEITVWDTGTGQQVANLRPPIKTKDPWDSFGPSEFDLHFSPDGRWLVGPAFTNSEPFTPSAALWKVPSFAPMQDLDLSDVYPVDFSPDSRSLTIVGKHINVTSIPDGSTVLRIGEVDPREFTRGRPEYTSDGSEIFLLDRKGARIWDAHRGTLKRTVEFARHSHVTPRMSHDGTRVFVASDDEIGILDAVTGEELLVLHGHASTVRGLHLSADDRRLYSWDKAGNLREWKSVQLSTNKNEKRGSSTLDEMTRRVTLEDRSAGSESRLRAYAKQLGEAMSQFEQGAVRGVSATLDETSKLDRGLEFDYAHHLVNGRSRRLEGYTSKDLVNSIAFVPGRDQLIATADDSTVRIWDTATGRQIQSLSTPGVRVNWNFMNPLKAASPSGTAFATADSKGRVCVWDLIEGVKRLDLKAPSGVIAVAFSGDGKRLGTITKDARFVMWDSQTGESIVGTTLAIDSYLPIRKGSLFLNYNGTAGVLQKDSPGGLVCAFQAAGGEVPFSLDQSVRDVAFSSDGERIAVSSGKTVKLLDANGHVVHVFPPDKWGRRVHFLAGDRQLAAFTSDSAVIWDVATREKLKGFDFGEGNGTPFLDMHIDGDMLQLRGYRNGQLETWSLADGKCLRRVPIPESLIRELGYPVAGPDLNRVGLFRNKELKIVDIPSQTVVLSEYPHLEQVIHEQGKSRYGRVAVRPDGSMFATGGDVLRIWAVGETSPVHVLQIRPWESSVHDVAFEPGGNWLAVLSSRTLAIVEPDSGRVLRRFDAAASVFSRLEIHPSGEAIVLTERGNGNDAEGIKVLCVVDVKTGKELVKVGHPDQRGFWDLAIHPSGDIVATAGREETVRLWDTRTLEPRGSIQFEAVSIQSLEFSGDGKTLVAVGSDQSIHVYDMAKKKVMQTLHSPGGDVWDVAAQGSEWIATSGESGDLRLWDLTEGEPGFAPIEGFPNGVQAVQLLGAQPIVIDEDGEVSVRLADGRWQALAHSDASQSVTQLAVSNETRRLAVGDRQGSVAIWEPSPLGEPVASKAQWMRRLHERSVRFLQFTVDGRRLISVDEENVLIISNTVSGEVLHSINLPMRPADLSCHPTLPSIAVLHENGALATWNTASGQLERESSRPLAGGTCLAFNEEGTRLFISGDDTDMMMVDPWSLEMLDAIKRENDPKRICQCTANRMLTLDGGSHVTVWESNLGVPLLTIKLAAKRPQHLAVADGRVLIAGEDGAWVWQAP